MPPALPPAPTSLPAGMPALVEELARLWAQASQRLRPDAKVSRHWDHLVAAWSVDPSLPLYVRKAENNRGSIVHHASGQNLVPTDNSPAQWAFAKAVLRERPSLEDIYSAIQEDRIPVAMILKVVEKDKATYRCTLPRVNPNSAGWKVCHVDGIGLGKGGSLEETNLPILQEHFRKLMAPSNMFVIPLRYAGLGELPEFCHAIRKLLLDR